MAVIGKVDRSKFGSIQARHVVVEDVTGPGTTVTVPAGDTADVTFTIAGDVPRNVQYVGVSGVSGLPSDIYIAGISVDADNKTITLTLFNHSGSDIDVDADSVTVSVVAVA